RLAVGGVDEDEIVCLFAAACALQDIEHVCAAHLGLAGIDLQRAEILAQHARRARVALDEHGACRPAREGLDSERAGAGEQVEDERSCDVPEQREDGLAHLVRGWPRAPPPRRRQAPATQPSRDHPHRTNRSGRRASDGAPLLTPAACPERLRSAAGAQARSGAIASRPYRLSSSSRNSACSGPSSSGSAAMMLCACTRARSSSAPSSGMTATLNWLTPDWRVPTSSPSLRNSRSISASLKPSECSAS